VQSAFKCRQNYIHCTHCLLVYACNGKRLQRHCCCAV